jgi:hypothetical protein
MMLQEINLHNFKAFERFTITFGTDAFIVGANNAGKSTIISAVKACARMLAIARRSKPNWWTEDEGITRHAYSFTGKQVTLVEENLRHEFRPAEVRIVLRFKNGCKVIVVWPAEPDESNSLRTDNSFFYLLDDDDAQPRSPRAVKDLFPTIGIIPVLYPIELAERVLEAGYVRSNIDGRLSSRHLRNQMYLLEGEDSDTHDNRLREFYSFAEPWLPEISNMVLRRSWTGEQNVLDLFYTELGSRSEREMVWAGDGLQVWLQLLLHVFRLDGSSTVLLDEPDLYLHADLQRRLVRLLEEHPAQTITATHSSEILAEASPQSITWVDKARRRAVRRPQDEQLGVVATALGSAFNLHVAKALRSKVALFVEGADMRLVRGLAQKADATSLANERNVAIVKLEGFSNWDKVEPFKWLIDNLLEGSMAVWVLLDRDYRTEHAAETVVHSLNGMGVHAHMWERKELESYLLGVPLIARCCGMTDTDVTEMLASVTDSLRNKVYSRMLAEKTRRKADAKLSNESVIESFSDEFDDLWSNLRWRLYRSPAKEVLSGFNRMAQDSGGKAVSARQLARRIRTDELSHEMLSVLTEIEASIN